MRVSDRHLEPASESGYENILTHCLDVFGYLDLGLAKDCLCFQFPVPQVVSSMRNCSGTLVITGLRCPGVA